MEIILKFLQDDKGNFSVTRLVFFLTSLLIIGLNISYMFIPITAFHIQQLYILCGFALSLVGIKNWKDQIIK